jgi:hypothetical protein
MVGVLCVASSCEPHLAPCRKAASTQLPAHHRVRYELAAAGIDFPMSGREHWDELRDEGGRAEGVGRDDLPRTRARPAGPD